jgi:YesN/AraC family two-component response regulator
LTNMETKKNSILVVDDEPGICKTLKMLFEKKWYEVSYALTGKEAVRTLKKRKFNVALLDIKLPDMEGKKLIPIFKKIHPDIKIVMMTGHSTKDNTIKSLNAGASYYFEKPFNVEELLTKTNELIEQQNKNSFQAILQEAAKLDMKKSGNAFPQDFPFKIQKAIKYIEKNYANPDLSLKEIASSVNMHPNSFSRLWSKSIKTNIPDFINDARIASAKKLLIETTEYTSQIAHKVGLSPFRFSRIFKEKTGISPTLHREQSIRHLSV